MAEPEKQVRERARYLHSSPLCFHFILSLFLLEQARSAFPLTGVGPGLTAPLALACPLLSVGPLPLRLGSHSLPLSQR